MTLSLQFKFDLRRVIVQEHNFPYQCDSIKDLVSRVCVTTDCLKKPQSSHTLQEKFRSLALILA